MRCADPAAAREIEREGVTEGPAFERHLAACAACRGVHAALRGGLAAELEPAHPSAAALVAFDEGAPALEPATRTWLERHLGGCDACREALAAVTPAAAEADAASGVANVPAPAPGAGGEWRRRVWPAAAAAGWIVAAVLAFRAIEGGEAEPAGDAVARTHTIVLSTQRGASKDQVPAEAEVLRFEFVLGEPVVRDSTLRLRIERRDGSAVLDRDVRVEELGDWDFPVITLRRGALPREKLLMKVTPPSGATATFEIDLGS